MIRTRSAPLIQNAPSSSGDIAFSAVSADPDLVALVEAEPGAALFTVDWIT